MLRRRKRRAVDLYGVALGPCFFGESMFRLEPDASKCAFAVFASALFEAGCPFVDCQTRSEHMERFGAAFLRRDDYLARLDAALRGSAAPGAASGSTATRKGPPVAGCENRTSQARRK